MNDHIVKSYDNELARLDGEIADLLDRSTTTIIPGTATTVPDTTPPDGAERLPNRVELVFAGVAQGIGYVPGGPAVQLGLELSTPAPVLADNQTSSPTTRGASAVTSILL